MNAVDLSQLVQILSSRRDAIADSWYQAIARASDVPLKATEVRQRLVELTEQAIALLVTDQFEHNKAQAIGVALAHLHYVQPEALGRMQEVLACRLVQGLPADQAVALQPRLAALLGGLADGFFQQAREINLAEQEQIYGKLVSETRRTEEALRESEEKLRAQYKGIPIPTYTWQRVGEDLVLVDYNDAAIAITQGKIADWVGVKAREKYQDEPEILAELLRCFTEKTSIEREMVYRFQFTGESKHLAVKYAFVPPDLVLVHAEDITERKRAEEALWKSCEEREELEHIVNHSPAVAFLWCNAEGWPVEFVSDNVRQFGYDPEDFYSGRMSFASIVHPDDLERVAVEVTRYSQEGHGEFVQEYRIITKTGDVRWLDDRTWIRRDSDGVITHYQGIVLDITERKRAEEALWDHTERLNILREIDSAILAAQSLEEIAETALRYVRQLVPCQRAGIVLFDFEANECQLLAVHVDGETKVGGGARLSLDGAEEGIEALRQGEVCLARDILSLSHLPPAAQMIQAEGLRSCLAAPLVSQGELIGSLNLWSDSVGAFVPDHVQVARELADSLVVVMYQARLRESVRQQGERLRALTARLAEAEEIQRRRLVRELHDQVGENLTVLGINLNLVRTHLPEETTELVYSRLDDSLALVEETVERIRGVMAELRPPMLDDFGLVATLHWYGAQFASRTGVTVMVEGDEPVSRLSAPAENALFRIVQEVLTNVAKHAQATQVVVTMAVGDETVRLVVADDGVGFDPARLAMPDGRQGWGLITMTERAEAVGGRFRIESRPQQGTRVIVEVAR